MWRPRCPGQIPRTRRWRLAPRCAPRRRWRGPSAGASSAFLRAYQRSEPDASGTAPQARHSVSLNPPMENVRHETESHCSAPPLACPRRQRGVWHRCRDAAAAPADGLVPGAFPVASPPRPVNAHTQAILCRGHMYVALWWHLYCTKSSMITRMRCSKAFNLGPALRSFFLNPLL